MATIEERARQYAANIIGGLQLKWTEGDVWNASERSERGSKGKSHSEAEKGLTQIIVNFIRKQKRFIDYDRRQQNIPC